MTRDEEVFRRLVLNDYRVHHLWCIPFTDNKSAHAGAKPYRAVYAKMVIYPFFEPCASFLSYLILNHQPPYAVMRLDEQEISRLSDNILFNIK